MKFKIKKYVYLLNDVTNLLLQKDREQAEVDVRKLKHLLAAIVAMLIMSLALNAYFIVASN